MDRAAAKLTAVVVLPTPPFWLATVKIRVLRGATIGSFNLRIPITALLGIVSRETLLVLMGGS
jgi:hypothetical protein